MHGVHDLQKGHSEMRIRSLMLLAIPVTWAMVAGLMRADELVLADAGKSDYRIVLSEDASASTKHGNSPASNQAASLLDRRSRGNLQQLLRGYRRGRRCGACHGRLDRWKLLRAGWRPADNSRHPLAPDRGRRPGGIGGPKRVGQIDAAQCHLWHHAA